MSEENLEPLNLRMPRGTKARLRALCQPGETITECLLRAIDALENGGESAPASRSRRAMVPVDDPDAADDERPSARARRRRRMAAEESDLDDERPSARARRRRSSRSESEIPEEVLEFMERTEERLSELEEAIEQLPEQGDRLEVLEQAAQHMVKLQEERVQKNNESAVLSALLRAGALRSQGKNFNEIASSLNAAGIPAPVAGGRWHASTVRQLLMS